MSGMSFSFWVSVSVGGCTYVCWLGAEAAGLYHRSSDESAAHGRHTHTHRCVKKKQGFPTLFHSTDARAQLPPR